MLIFRGVQVLRSHRNPWDHHATVYFTKSPLIQTAGFPGWWFQDHNGSESLLEAKSGGDVFFSKKAVAFRASSDSWLQQQISRKKKKPCRQDNWKRHQNFIWWNIERTSQLLFLRLIFGCNEPLKICFIQAHTFLFFSCAKKHSEHNL